jgi:CDP-diacylglycerol--glycerol-3-phosphate 3-phosphatidyltransferase
VTVRAEAAPRDPAAVPASGARVVNPANAITLVRLLLVPVFLALLLAGSGTGWRVGALAAFAVATVTDWVDGELARNWQMVTDVGKIADPIADKALVGGALIALSALGELPWWVTGLVVAREIGVTALRFLVIRRGVIPASRGGKVKTALQAVAIGMYVLPLHGAPASARAWLMAAAVVVTLLTGLDYVFRAAALRREPRSPAAP